MELSPASVSSCIEQTRLGFMYAPYYHPVMKSVKAVRSALQVCVYIQHAVMLPLQAVLHNACCAMTGHMIYGPELLYSGALLFAMQESKWVVRKELVALHV